jgi:hypothetical protein
LQDHIVPCFPFLARHGVIFFFPTFYLFFFSLTKAVATADRDMPLLCAT